MWAIPGLLLVAGLAFLISFTITAREADIQCAAAFGLTAVPFVLAAIDSRDRLLHPLSLFGFAMVFGVAGQTVYLTRIDTTNPDFGFLLSGLGTDSLTPALLTVAAALAALAVGYFVSPRTERPTPGRVLRWAVGRGVATPQPGRVLWVVIALCVVAMAAFALYAARVGLDSLDALLASQKRYGTVGGEFTALGQYRFGMSLAGLAFVLVTYTVVRSGATWRSKLGWPVWLR